MLFASQFLNIENITSAEMKLYPDASLRNSTRRTRNVLVWGRPYPRNRTRKHYIVVRYTDIATTRLNGIFFLVYLLHHATRMLEELDFFFHNKIDHCTNTLVNIWLAQVFMQWLIPLLMLQTLSLSPDLTSLSPSDFTAQTTHELFSVTVSFE